MFLPFSLLALVRGEPLSVIGDPETDGSDQKAKS